MHEPDPGPRHAFPDIPRTAGPLGDMPADEFRAAGHALVEWIADYLQHAERYPVMAQVEPGAIARSVPSAAPDHGESIGAILADIDRVIVPGLTHWNSPTFFAYFSICASGPGVLADFSLGGAQSTGDAVAHVARCDRARSRHARLAAPVDGPARTV